MTWFFAILVVVLLGGVAVVASGRGGSMAETFDDRPDALVPGDRPLAAPDLRRVRFSTAFRGYRMSEVDALLDRLAAELELRGSRASDPRVPVDPGMRDSSLADSAPADSAPADSALADSALADSTPESSGRRDEDA
jgi:DivIVA domain-containing protein